MKDNNCIFCKLANGDIPTNSIYWAIDSWWLVATSTIPRWNTQAQP